MKKLILYTLTIPFVLCCAWHYKGVNAQALTDDGISQDIKADANMLKHYRGGQSEMWIGVSRVNGRNVQRVYLWKNNKSRSDTSGVGNMFVIFPDVTINGVTNNGPGAWDSADFAYGIWNIKGLQSALDNKVNASDVVNADWNAINGKGAILNKPVLFDGTYAALIGKPALFDGKYSSLTGQPALFTPTQAASLFNGLDLRIKNDSALTASKLGTADAMGMVAAMSDRIKQDSLRGLSEAARAQAAEALKQNKLAVGTADQYYRGDQSLATLPFTKWYGPAGAINNIPIKKWVANGISPTTANGFTIDISSAGFTAILSAQVQAYSASGTIATIPLVSGQSITNTQLKVSLVQSGTTLVGALGATVSGLAYLNPLTGVTLSVEITGY